MKLRLVEHEMPSGRNYCFVWETVIQVLCNVVSKNPKISKALPFEDLNAWNNKIFRLKNKRMDEKAKFKFQKNHFFLL